MKFTLKDYQDEAVRKVLEQLAAARKYWHQDTRPFAFSLSAITGAGKTVMAAAVFEALFHGDDDRNFEADPGAVVIWFSDDPSLNEQTRFRLQEASDRLSDRLRVVSTGANNRWRFDPGYVYFLNTQKLGKNSLLVRGHEQGDDRQGTLALEIRPDNLAYSIWETIQNTIEDPQLTLYLVLDEAHRGMGSLSKSAQTDKSTIVTRLINGGNGMPPIPVVWGISATVDRFNKAMAGARGRGTLENVTVDAAKVQDSGLLKDTIILDSPKNVGPFDTVILRRATAKLKAMTSAWDEYARQQEDARPVVPLMVLQVPNKPDPKEIGAALDTILQEWPELPRDAIAHVFGEHSTQKFDGYSAPYISPEQVHDARWIRVLIAKDAISTGWDCPRAEVMVSFRPAKDRTHITQLLGRMVRAPLARRIPGNERLNAVECLLPFFDSETVNTVADSLMRGGDDEREIPGRRVLNNAIEMTPNPRVPEAVFEVLANLPSQFLPKPYSDPVKRLTALAHELAFDGLVENAGKKAYGEMYSVLDAARARYGDKIAKARASVLNVEGQSLSYDLKNQTKSLDDFWEAADYTVINDVYRRAARVLGADLAHEYATKLADKAADTDQETDIDEIQMAARADIAAMGLVPEVKSYLDAEAGKMASKWLADNRVAIKGLSDERQEVYRLIREMSTKPTDIDLSRPKSRMECTTIREKDGNTRAIPTYQNHILCDADGNFPVDLNDWERAVLEVEQHRQGFVAWYRNPARSTRESLGIVYTNAGEYKVLRPDFLFFTQQEDGHIVADLVDPHGIHLSDALSKLRGLAQFIENHPKDFRRVEVVAKVGDTLRVLDLTDGKVRQAVHEALDARSLYETSLASDYS